MNVWAKMVTALRGGVQEAGEAVVDSQALRILDQEVRDASEELNQSKAALADIMARQKVAEEKAKQIEARVAEHEGYAVKALDKGDETLAGEVAQRIAEFENQLTTEKDVGAGFADSAKQLREAVSRAEQNIAHLKSQVDTVKAVDSVQRAQAAVADRFSGSNTKLRTAMESLERIKEQHALEAAKMTAASELGSDTIGTDLRKKLDDAGITSPGNQADDVLSRLKAQRSGAKVAND